MRESLVEAEKLYSGQQHIRLMRGVAAVREGAAGANLSLWIVSAGYGLVRSDQMLAPYEATFSGMSLRQVAEWSQKLGLPKDVKRALSSPYDIGIVLLGDSYLAACSLGSDLALGGPTVFLCAKGSAARVPRVEGARVVQLGIDDTRRYGAGLVALKGEIAYDCYA